MELEQTVFIPSERSVVWAGLNDPEILKRSLPGCEHFEVTGENQFEMVVTTRIGPVKATFRGKIELSNIEAPHRYVINGEGKGGVDPTLTLTINHISVWSLDVAQLDLSSKRRLDWPDPSSHYHLELILTSYLKVLATW